MTETKRVTTHQIDRLIKKAGKQRDAIRDLIEELAPVLETLECADEDYGVAIRSLEEARDSLVHAADTVSQYA